ncbi:MAG: hypothetical protein KDD04_12925, partial [Sinomicrobium sp.]|nr:hypothetical protein [Sinomicrobium sp.]
MKVDKDTKIFTAKTPKRKDTLSLFEFALGKFPSFQTWEGRKNFEKFALQILSKKSSRGFAPWFFPAVPVTLAPGQVAVKYMAHSCIHHRYPVPDTGLPLFNKHLDPEPRPGQLRSQIKIRIHARKDLQ